MVMGSKRQILFFKTFYVFFLIEFLRGLALVMPPGKGDGAASLEPRGTDDFRSHKKSQACAWLSLN